VSYSLDANLLLYATDEASEWHGGAKAFLKGCARDPDILCLTWPVLMAYQRIATHPAIFVKPLPPGVAWENVMNLISLPRARVITETDSFPSDYARVTGETPVHGNLVPDAHIATILMEHGVRKIYSSDRDFRKFDFLEAVNPLK
jgi:uncharacterized protein